MAQVLLINGSPNEFGCTYTALKEVENTLNQNGVQTEFLYLGRKPISGCISCWKCQQTGKCVIQDIVQEVSAKLDKYDGIVIGSPVYYAGPAGMLCAFLDRLFFSNERRMAGKLGAAIVSCRRGGASAAFERLNKYFEISNMQTMRTLAQNMAWLLKCIEAGKEKGIDFPTYEPRQVTHFIMDKND